MNNDGRFGFFARTLAGDRTILVELDRILGQAHAVNIDFRGAARSRLLDRVGLLLYGIEREFYLLDGIDPRAANDHARAGDLVLAIGRLLAQAREGAFAFGRALERASAPDLDKGFELDVRVALGQAFDGCVALVGELERSFAQPFTQDSPECEQSRRPSAWMSWRILNLAVCVLPREERRRYLDEYASELHDLTQVEGLSGRTQIGYALRLLARTPALVFVLRSSASQASQRRIHAESSPYRVENT